MKILHSNGAPCEFVCNNYVSLAMDYYWSFLILTNLPV